MHYFLLSINGDREYLSIFTINNMLYIIIIIMKTKIINKFAKKNKKLANILCERRYNIYKSVLNDYGIYYVDD